MSKEVPERSGRWPVKRVRMATVSANDATLASAPKERTKVETDCLAPLARNKTRVGRCVLVWAALLPGMELAAEQVRGIRVEDARSTASSSAASPQPTVRGRPPVSLDGILERPGADFPNLMWLPDSDRIVFTLGRYYEPQKTVILSTRTGERKEIGGLTVNFGGSSQLSGDGARLAYLKEGWLWIVPLRGEMVPARIARLDLSLGKAYDDSKIFCWGDADRAVYYTQRPKRPPKAKPRDDEPTAVDFDPYAELPLPLEIFRLDLGTKESRRLAQVDADIRDLTWNPHASELHVATVRLWGYNERQGSSQILALDPKTGKTREVLRTAGGSQSLRSHFSPDGRWVATTYDYENVVYDFRNNVVLIDTTSGAQRALAPELHVGEDLEWSPDSGALYARVLDGGFNGIRRLGVDGSVRILERGERYIDAFALAPDGTKYVSLTQDGQGRRELRLSDSNGSNPRVLLTIDDPTREFVMGEFREISWPSFDGMRIYGFEIRPVGFDPKKRYPMLVDVHGGGPGSRLYLSGGVILSSLERQLWAGRGYVVFVPDYRSAATAYGPGVIEKMRGRSYSVTDTRDIMAGVDFMVAQGYVDPDRIALLGQSAGAHRVNVLLPTTTRFRVAVSNEGWGNGWIVDSTGPMTGRWEHPITEWFFRTTRAENPEPWFAEDPMTRLHEIRTPTLLISGTPELGAVDRMTNEYIFTMLRRKGIDTKLVLFPDEGHGTTRVANQRYLMGAVLEGFERHLDLKRDEAGHLVFQGDRVASNGNAAKSAPSSPARANP